ncbi:hypothetical protein PULV_a2030 [Pseudoalteromonas ulvae UL12]|uniref:GGDEF domain-containing protein n=1 Tax=Pseudoalteromonas ulvae TaxID=107327 RepID=UPI00186B5DF0|nr:GGDEF domain-containing protein [Pseudoalteromonas ulvae]MBE0365264.1 hypothetical protein [Pseudoalteromonas ulvae UL12]
MIDDQALILIQAICLINGFACFAWGVMAYPLAIAPHASRIYSLANAHVFIGVFLTSLRADYNNYLTWQIADFFTLSGFYLLRYATQRLFKQPTTAKYDGGFVLLACCVSLLFSPEPSSDHALGLIFSIFSALVFFLLSLDLYRNAQSMTSRKSAVFLASPIILLAGIFAFRACFLLIFGQNASPYTAINTHEAIPMLWFYLLLALLINCTMIGAAIMRLILKVRQYANNDPLTQTLNRRAAFREIAQLQAATPHQPFAVLLIDLDHFKHVNDTLGHDAGDKALIVTSRLFEQNLTSNDLLCRYGGEEFLIYLNNASPEQAHSLAETLLHTLANTPFTWLDSCTTLSASIGLAHSSQTDSFTDLIHKADLAMYQAKAAGRNCIRSI